MSGIEEVHARRATAQRKLDAVWLELAAIADCVNTTEPEIQALQDEASDLEAQIATLTIMANLHAFAVTLARLQMSENAGNN